MLGIAGAQIDLDAALARPAAGDLEHLRAELDAGEVYLRGIEVEVPAGADANLQHLATRPRADPLPPGTKEHPLQKSDEPVVILGSPVVVPPDTLRPVPVRTHPTAVATIIDPVDGGRRKSSSSYMFCCEALLSAICTDLLAFCEGVNVFGGSCIWAPGTDGANGATGYQGRQTYRGRFFFGNGKASRERMW